MMSYPEQAPLTYDMIMESNLNIFILVHKRNHQHTKQVLGIRSGPSQGVITIQHNYTLCTVNESYKPTGCL